MKTQNKTDIYGETKKEIVGGGSTERYPRSVVTFSSDKQRVKLHSTQKPLSLIEYMIKTYTNEGDLILDNACGSGTTLLGAAKLGRDYIGIEMEETYYNITLDRLKDFR